LSELPSSIPSLDPDDELIWAGKPAYRRRRVVIQLILIIFVLIDLIVLKLYGIASNSAFFAIVVFLLLVNLSYIVKNEGVRYFITKRLIILERSSLFLRRTRKIRLGDLKDIESNGRNKLLLHPTAGETMVFNLLETEVARVEGIFLKARNEFKARSEGRSSMQ
jgi:hypothetical protein